MASMKDVAHNSSNHTAIKYLDGKRVLMGYPNGSIFMAFRDGFIIQRKLSFEETNRYEKESGWKAMP